MDDSLWPVGLRNLSAAECDEFWRHYAALRPGLRLQRGNHYSRWRPVAGTDIFIALYLTNRSVGMFVRGERGLSLEGAARMLSMHEPRLSRALNAPPFDQGCPYLTRLPLDTRDRQRWAQGHEWLIKKEEFYHRVLARIVGRIETPG
jgi:hypothetical protein